MKVFRELYLHLSEEQTDQFFHELEKILPEGWQRETDAEQRSSKEAGIKYYYFSCRKSGTLEPALIAFARKDNEIIYIANIVPREISELTNEQYNMILSTFLNDFLRPICEKFSVKVDVTSGNQSMRDWVSEETYKKIRSFSVTANKSTGSAHPCDQERWFAFIVSVLRNNEKLDPTQLERWLVEEEGWHYDIASELAIEYEQGLSLLNYYVNH